MKEKIQMIIESEPYLGINDFYYYFYKIINLDTNEYYYGVHKTKDLNDGYAGSGRKLKKVMNKNNISLFKKEILKFFQTSEEMFEYEESIVNKDLVLDKNCYNMHTGGSGSWDFTIGRVCVKDASGNFLTVDKTDPKYLNGEYKSNMVGMIHVIDSSNNHVTITTEEFKNNKDKYKAFTNGHVVAKDKNGNKISITQEQFDILSKTGEVTGATKNKGVFKDKFNNYIMCDINDPRVLSGELVGSTKGVGIYKFKNDFSKTCITSKDDPRVLSGELVGINYGLVYARNSQTGEKITVEKGDPRLKTGELITCIMYKKLHRKLK